MLSLTDCIPLHCHVVLRWNGPQLSKMQCSKLKRAMENQGVNWPLASEVKVLPNGKKQTVRSILDEASAASAASAPSLQQHVDSSFFHNVKFKGHLCKTPHPLPPFFLTLLLQPSPQPPRPPPPPRPPLTLRQPPPPLTLHQGTATAPPASPPSTKPWLTCRGWSQSTGLPLLHCLPLQHHPLALPPSAIPATFLSL